MLRYVSDYKDVKFKETAGFQAGDSYGQHPDEGVTIAMHGNYVFVSEHPIAAFSGGGNLHDRPQIEGLSDSSVKRMRRYLRSAVADYVNMITLTYPFTYPMDGKVCKEHLRKFLQELNREAVRHSAGHGFSAFWFIEFQERGAPHFHLLTTWSPMDSIKGADSWVKKTWYRIVGSEDPRHLAAGTREEKLKAGKDGMVGYVTKYAQKEEQKTVPDAFKNVGRFWGIHGLRDTLCAVVQIDKASLQKPEVQRWYKAAINILRDACARADAGAGAGVYARARVCVRKEGFLMVKLSGDFDLLRFRMALTGMGRMMFPDEGFEMTLFSDAELTL